MLPAHLQRISAVVTAPCLLALLWQDAQCAAAPASLNTNVEANVGVEFQRSGGKLVPVNLKINSVKFPITQQNGRWGVAVTHRQLMQAAPAYKDALDQNIAQLMVKRAGELAATGKGGIDATLSREENTARFAAEAGQLTSRFNTAYETMLDQKVFAMPHREWRLIDAAAAGAAAAAEDDQQQAQNKAEGEKRNTSNNFWVWLGALVLLVVSTVAPLAALLWLASTALTLASLATAAIGVTLAISAGMTFNAGMRAIAGLPLYDYYYGPGSGPGGNYGPRR